MKLLRLCFGFVLALGFAASGWTQTDTQAAQATFQSGIQQETAKNYRDALSFFQTALKADPSNPATWKEMGNCYYNLGYKTYALQCYDRYNQLNPTDTQTRILADSLRQQSAAPLAAPIASPAVEPTKAPAKASRPKVGLELSLAYNGYVFEDYNVDNPPSNYIAIHLGKFVKSGIGYGGSLMFRPDPAFQIGFDADFLNLKNDGAGYLQEGSTRIDGDMNYKAPALWIGPSVYIVVSATDKLKFRLGGGAGYFSIIGGNITFTPSGAYKVQSLDLTGSTVAFKVGGGIDYFFTPHYSLGVDVGYRVAKISTIHGSISGWDPLEKPDKSNWPFDYSGIVSKVKLGFEKNGVRSWDCS